MNQIRTYLTGTAALLSLSLSLAFAPTAEAWGWGTNVTGSGTAKTEARQVSGFTGISLSLPAKVTLIQGDKESLTIEGDDNVVPLIESVVERGSLKLRFTEKNLNLKTKTPLRITVYAKTIESLSVAGSGDIVADQLKSPTLKTSIAGSGDVAIKNLSADTLKVSISGSGDFAAGGKVDAIEANVAGSGDIKAGRLESKTVKISIAGSGDATVWAKEGLQVSVAGSGDVKYYGDPEIKKSVLGSGSMKRLGATPQ
jgi:hypothetical protein